MFYSAWQKYLHEDFIVCLTSNLAFKIRKGLTQNQKYCVFFLNSVMQILVCLYA